MDFDPNLFGGKIGKTLIDPNENFYLNENKTPSPARDLSIKISQASGKLIQILLKQI